MIGKYGYDVEFAEKDNYAMSHFQCIKKMEERYGENILQDLQNRFGITEADIGTNWDEWLSRSHIFRELLSFWIDETGKITITQDSKGFIKEFDDFEYNHWIKTQFNPTIDYSLPHREDDCPTPPPGASSGDY